MRGRLVTTEALVLSRRQHREADRVAAVYTADFGKVPVRFPGVDRPAAKLRSLAEPLVHLDLRMYVRHGAEYATAAGGALLTGYPGLRGRLEVLMRGLGVLELLERLTPWWEPSPDKLALTLGALRALEGCAGPDSTGWVYSAYALRLFEAAGYGMRARRVSEENRSLWEALHTAPWDAVAGLPADPLRVGRLEALVATTVEHTAERQLRWMQVREKMRVRLSEAAAPGAGR